MERKREHQGTRDHQRRARWLAAALGAAVGVGALALPQPASASAVTIPVTGRVDVTTAGAQVSGSLTTWMLISSDGRFVAFSTSAAIDPKDTNGNQDAYVRDRVAGTTTRVGLSDADAQVEYSGVCGMSRDGRFVAFVAFGTGLPVPDSSELYLRDRTLGTTTLISRASDGTPAGPGPGGSAALNDADRCPVSDDGRYVAFQSASTNLVAGDASPNESDAFRRDRQTSTTIRVSSSTGGTANNGFAGGLSMSADGNVITFTSDADDLVAGDTNSTTDVFVRTITPATMTRANTKADGGQIFGGSGSGSISADGTKVAFGSSSSDLPGGNGSQSRIYVKVRATNAVALVSTDSGGATLGGTAGYPSISDDGTRVAFTADLPDGTADDPNKVDDIYLKNTATGLLSVISTTSAGTTGNATSFRAAVAGNGTAVAFFSAASDLVRSDTNGKTDVFVRDLAVDIAPFVSTTALVKQQFVDFLGRQPSAAELTEWKAKLANGEKTPDQIIDDLAHGATFAGKRAPMIRLYWAFFLRAPDQNGLAYWVGKLEAGKSLASVAAQFAKSSEFQTKYGSKTNSQFVTVIYQNIFRRDPDAAGLAYWTGKLDAKTKTRGDVMVNFSESSEGKRVLAPQTDTILHTLGMLKTMPSKLYLDTLLIQKGEWISQVQVGSFRSGAAYAARITP